MTSETTRIAVFAGTTEGRRIAEHFSCSAGETAEQNPVSNAFETSGNMPELHVYTASDYGASLLPEAENVIVHAGRLTEEEIAAELKKYAPVLCVDATHPYAAVVSENLKKACMEAGVRYLRVLRGESAGAFRAADGTTYRASDAAADGTARAADLTADGIAFRAADQAADGIAFRTVDAAADGIAFRAADTASAAAYLNSIQGNILITTGSKELHLFKDVEGFTSRCFARVLPTVSVLQKCTDLGLPASRIIAMQGPFSEEMNLSLMRSLKIDCLVTKDSGEEGGCPEKLSAARKAGAKIVLIGRPVDDPDAVSLEQAVSIITETITKEQVYITKTSRKVSDCEPKAEGVDIIRRQRCGEMPEICRWNVDGVDITGNDPTGASDRTVNITTRTCAAIGMGPGAPEYLTEAAADYLRSADLLIGSKRMIEAADARYPGAKNRQHLISIKPGETVSYLRTHTDYSRAAILYSGDITRYSGAKQLRELLEREPVEHLRFLAIPGISSVQYFLAALGLHEQDVTVMSAHGRDVDLIPTIRTTENLIALVGTEDIAYEITETCERLGLSDIEITVGERLSYEDERIYRYQKDLGNINKMALILIHNPHPAPNELGFGLSDSAFLRSKVPMTKREVRSLSLSLMGLHEEDTFLDVGAGTGSISIEAALKLRRGRVYAVEKKEEAAALIEENARKFGCTNISVIRGEAPEALNGLPVPDAVFIGGSTGQMEAIVHWVFEKNPDAVICANAVTEETIAELTALRKRLPETKMLELTEVQVVRRNPVGRYHMRMAENPIVIALIKNR